MHEVQQNTPEWLEMRKSKIGASDAAPIVGVSPYMTAYQLWQEKLGLSASRQVMPHMRRGLDLEEKARHEVEKMTGLFFLPQVKFHRSIPYLMASLDGIDVEGKHIVEIKCPNKADHQSALAGQVPEKYIPQLQHQMEVCEVEMVYYFSFDGEKGVLVQVQRDDLYIKKMLQKEQDFWDCMQSFTAPEMTEKDYEFRDDDLWAEASSRWKSLQKDKKLFLEPLRRLEEEEEKIKSALISMAQGKNCRGDGVAVSKVFRKGTLDCAKLEEVVDLERYRKSPSEYYRINVEK